MQLIHVIPLIWKQKINDSEENVWTNYAVQDHHLIKTTRVIVWDKLTVREIHFSVTTIIRQYTNFLKKFRQSFSKAKISLKENLYITRKSHYSFQCNFQYKMSHNILYLNKVLFTFGKTKTPVFNFSFMRWDY